KSGAQLISADQIKVDQGVIQAKNIIIATGSSPIELAGLKFNQGNLVSSSQLLNVKSIPEKLLVIGAGVIGCEFAGLFSQFGSQVTLVEKTNQILPGMDADIARKLENVFKKSGIEVKTGIEVSENDTRNYTLALLCVGRAADFSSLGVQAAGVRLKSNKIEVDEYLRTSVANIYAAGDCAAKYMLAHYAAYQGRLAVENIFSARKIKADNSVVPNCIFTQPQICAVGLSQKEAQDSGLKIRIHKFDYLASGAARILDQADGFIKAISDQDSGRILGVSLIGPEACELSAVFSVAISSRLSVEDFRKMIFAHPTLAESAQECLNS
ncbi:MAG: NAD(P)/FAD-dependent oxidoreductase, partial [Candidatus Omnitrophica bacterium]|nr:NAD(P)/FAD-dependent oxidoreductase [Candidatus Omnitrophota bacterium]